MNKRKIFIILIFLFTCNAFSDEKILQCGSNKYRIKLPMVGFDKFYIEDGEKWKKLKNFEVTEDFYLVKDATDRQEKCSTNECKTNIYISKKLTGDSHLEYTIKAASENCKIGAFDINKFLIQEEAYDCYERKIGFSLEKGYCKLLKNK